MSVDRHAERLPEELPDDPMHWAASWFERGIDEQVQRNPNSMTLVSVGADQRPSARVVLCKSFLPDPGYLVLYTNYRSRKCVELDNNPHVSLVLHWDELRRQIRIEGIAVKSPPAESDAYFASRDRGSQLGAWGSDQSRPIASRDALLRQLDKRAAELGISDDPDKPIPRPAHWGGIRVWADAVELWIEGADRVHERARWTRELTPESDSTFASTPWVGTRLQP